MQWDSCDTPPQLRYELDALRRRHAHLALKANVESSEAGRTSLGARVEVLQGQVDSAQAAYDAAEQAVNTLLHELIERSADVQDVVKQALQAESAALLRMAAPEGLVAKSFKRAAAPTPEEVEEDAAATKVAVTVDGQAPSVDVVAVADAGPLGASAYAT